MTGTAARRSLRERYGADLARLSAAVEADSDQEFLDVLDELLSLRRRELFARLRHLTDRLQRALERFHADSRFAQLAEREVPDARARLAHVLKLTDQAAHRTIDLVDRSVPLAARAREGAEGLAGELADWRGTGESLAALNPLLERIATYLAQTCAEAAELKHNLNEVVLTQTFQDLTGQIIRSVIALVLELETTLGDLLGLAGDAPGPVPAGGAVRPRVPEAGAHGAGGSAYGPIVPGVTTGPVVAVQADVDDLLSGLGL